MGTLIDTTDVFGNRITCTHETWMGHISCGQPIMVKNMDAVVDTIQNPEVVYQSSQNPESKVYFKESDTSSYSMYTKVVTRSTSNTEGEIVSAWPQRVIKGGIGDEIYHKQD